jgi:AraC-like DNA-binding protein
MRAKLEQFPQDAHEHSFLCYEVKAPSFDFYWHYHPEYELTFILKGEGKRLVGDTYEAFKAGDTVLLPPLLPHTWISEKGQKGNCLAIVIKFSQTSIEKLSQLPELARFKKLLTTAARGLQFTGPKSKEVVPLLKLLLQGDAVTKLTSFLQVLNEITQAKAIPIASVHYKPLKGNENQQRLNAIFRYVEKEFRSAISLKKAASLIHLSESAFCKYFKRASGKTFSDYTNDIRIAHACELLIETDKPISEIALQSGFESLSYFNRVFLAKKKQRPREYRNV